MSHEQFKNKRCVLKAYTEQCIRLSG